MDMTGVNIETTIEGMEGIRNAVVILVEDRAPDITLIYMTSDQDRVNRLRIYAEKFNYQRAPEEVHRELEVFF